ncbi:MAG: glycosyltransferase [Acetobacteraceae bacterium]
MSDLAHRFTPSLAHRFWRGLPSTWRRRALAAATAGLAPRPDRLPPAGDHGIVLGGEFSRPSGLGEGARVMARAARSLGLPVWRLDVPPPIERADTIASPAALPPAGAPLILHVNAPYMPLALMRLPHGLMRGRRIVGYWSWELPEVPAEWRVGPRFVHEIWAPSRFTAAALEPLLPGRVRVVPPALAAVGLEPAHLGRAAFGLPEQAIVVLLSFNMASSFERKNPLAAIAAFRAAFGDRPDRVLVVKVIHADHAPEDFARLRAAAQGPNIRIETRVMSDPERHALTAASDIVLSLHRSEGLGLVPAEAMMLGRAVVATGWSGNMDYMDRDTAALVRYRLVPARDRRQVYQDAPWAEPDIGDAVVHLRMLADNTAARLAMGRRAQASVRLHFGTEKLQSALRGLGLALPRHCAGTLGRPCAGQPWQQDTAWHPDTAWPDTPAIAAE